MSESQDIYACLEEIAKNRHCLVRGSELDMEKAARLLLDDFRNGRIGRITLEFPQDYGRDRRRVKRGSRSMKEERSG